MTFALAFRTWARRASVLERCTTACVLLVALAIATWAVVPDNHDQTVATAAVSTVPTTSSAPDTTATTSPSTTTSVLDQVLPDGAPNVPTTLRPSTTVPASTTTEARRASDRGITADTIKIGFTIVNAAGLGNLGFSPGLRNDIPQVITALVDAANKRGGVNGRKIVADPVRVDPLNPSDQRAKCLQLIEDHQVFGIVDVVGFVHKPAQSCVSIEHDTPFVHSNPLSTAFMKQGAPYDVSLTNDQNRMMFNWVQSAKALGYLDPAKGFKGLGLLVDECVPEAVDGPTGLRADLRAAGVPDSKVSEFRFPCDLTQGLLQASQAVLQHKQAGVNLVFPGTTYTTIQTYLANAKSQGFGPTYFASDYRGMPRDAQAKSFEPDQFDRTRAMTILHSGALSAPAKACSKTLTDHGLPPITNYDTDTEALSLCENLDLFVRIAAAAGTNPTRLSWGNAVQTIGKVSPATIDTATFDRPGKVSGGDTLSIVEWRRQCTCWVQTRGFQPAYG